MTKMHKTYEHPLSRLIALMSFCLVVLNPIAAQLPPNGGFENWIPAGNNERPEDWMAWFVSFGDFCNEPLFSDTSDAYEGEKAILLEAHGCFNAGGGAIVYPGLVQSGNTGVFPPYSEGITFTERPEQLSFYHKFFPAGTDTAIVDVLLYTYDFDNYEILDTIGSAQMLLTEEQTEYEEIILPIEYHLPTDPEIARVYFNTSYANYRYSLNLTPNVHGFDGTKLIIDKVEFQGGTLSVGPERARLGMSVSPNPAQSELRVELDRQTSGQGLIHIYNEIGEVIHQAPFEGTLQRIDCVDWPRGVYIVRIQTEDSRVSQRIVLE